MRDLSSLSEVTAVGVMSGTSLDGVDVVLAKFTHQEQWSFQILESKVIPYPEHLLQKLQVATELSAWEYTLLEEQLSAFWAEAVQQLASWQEAELIAVHGQSVFHRPDLKITRQIFNPYILLEACKKPVVFDFRTRDLAMGGQGAPLVPVGDHLLFHQYVACVNLGGFGNLSYPQDVHSSGFDFGVCNNLLNHLAQEINLEYDKDGAIAASATADHEVIKALHQIPFFQKEPPKSVGYEWYEQSFFPIWDELTQHLSVEDRLATACGHIAFELSRWLSRLEGDVLITGGGALNLFLMEQIRALSGNEINIAKAEKELVEQKEALVFAFLGVLRMRNETNVYQRVTGAYKDHSAGLIAYP